MNCTQLRDARKKRGFTQEELAKKIGYAGKSGYSFLESGKIGVSIEISKKIKEALSLSDEEYRLIFLE